MATRNWIGGTDLDMCNSANYDGVGAILPTDDLVFSLTLGFGFIISSGDLSIHSLSINTDSGDYQTDGWTFNSPYTITIGGNLTIVDGPGIVFFENGCKMKFTATTGEVVLGWEAVNYLCSEVEFASVSYGCVLGAIFYTPGDITVSSGYLDLAGYSLGNGSGTLAVGALGTLKWHGTETLTFGTFSWIPGWTVEYTATSGTVTLQNWTYSNLKINGLGGTFKFGQAHTEILAFTLTAGTFSQAAGDYAITCTSFTQAGGTFTGGTAALIVNGAWGLATGTFTSTSGTLTVAGNFIRTSGTFTHNSGTLNLTGTDTLFTCTQAVNILTLNKTGVANTVTLGGNLTANNTITVTVGTLVLAGYSVASTGAFTITSGSTLRLKGSESTIKTPTLDDGSIVEYVGDNTTNTLAIKQWIYKTLVFNDVNASKATFQLTTTIAFTMGIFTSGIVDFNGQVVTNGGLTIGTNITLKLIGSESIGCAPSINSGLVQYTGAGTYNLQRWIYYTNITISGSGVFTAVAPLICGAAGNVTVSAGTLAMANQTLTVPGTLTVSNGATLSQTGDAAYTIGTTTLGSTSTVVYTATSGSRAVRNWTYGNLTINGSGGTFLLGESHTGISTMALTAGTFNLNGFNLTTSTAFTVAAVATLRLKGIETVSTPTITSGGTVVYYGNNVASVKTLNNWTYSNLTINDINTNKSTFQLAEAHTGIATLSVMTGTFNILDNLTAVGFTVSPNVTVNFGAGKTFTFTGITWDGTLGNLIVLRSTVDGSSWHLVIAGGDTVSYVDVKDSDASGGGAITASQSTNRLGNTNWIFPGDSKVSPEARLVPRFQGRDLGRMLSRT